MRPAKLPQRTVEFRVLIDARDPTSRDATHAATFGTELVNKHSSAHAL
jgi:hypothetical protein